MYTIKFSWFPHVTNSSNFVLQVTVVLISIVCIIVFVQILQYCHHQYLSFTAVDATVIYMHLPHSPQSSQTDATNIVIVYSRDISLVTICSDITVIIFADAPTLSPVLKWMTYALVRQTSIIYMLFIDQRHSWPENARQLVLITSAIQKSQ